MDCPILHALDPLPDEPVVVAFSGGMDSTVLLHALQRRGARALSAIHVDHGLQAAAGGWAAHCRALVARWSIPLQVVRAEIDPASPGGLEAAAREARYAALAAALPPGALLALAHHQDDQAETVLLRLLRRAGPRGLSAMQSRSQGAAGLQLWRPLLGLPRASLLDYADRHGLPRLDDPMNADPRFDRVFLRREILPMLTARWPQAPAALAASAALLGAARERQGRELRQALARCRGLDPASLLLDPLARLPADLRRPVVEAWLDDLGLAGIPAALSERLARGLPVERAERGFPHLLWQGWRIERYRNELHAAAQPERPTGGARPWDGRGPLELAQGVLALEGASALPFAGTVVARAGGERIRLPGRAHRSPLKHCLQDLGVPPRERDRLPLLVDAGGQVAAAGDLLYADAFEAWLHAHGARLRWTPT